MGERNTPEQQRGYIAAQRERQRKAGLKRHEVLAHDEDWPLIKRLADRLRAKREQSASRS